MSRSEEGVARRKEPYFLYLTTALFLLTQGELVRPLAHSFSLHVLVNSIPNFKLLKVTRTLKWKHCDQHSRSSKYFKLRLEAKHVLQTISRRYRGLIVAHWSSARAVHISALTGGTSSCLGVKLLTRTEPLLTQESNAFQQMVMATRENVGD